MDQQTFTFIYNLYFDPLLRAASSTGSTGPSGTEGTASSPPSSRASSVTASASVSSSTNASLSGAIFQPPTTSGGLSAGFVGSGAQTTFQARPEPIFSTLTQTLYTTSTFTCSDGNLESTVFPTVTELVYDPSLNTLVTITYSSTTIVTLVAAGTVTADSAELPTGFSASNSTNNDQASDPVYTPVTAAARGTMVRNDQLMLWVMLLTFFLGL